MIPLEINKPHAPGDKISQGIEHHAIFTPEGIPFKSEPEFKKVPEDEKMLSPSVKRAQKIGKARLKFLVFRGNMGIP